MIVNFDIQKRLVLETDVQFFNPAIAIVFTQGYPWSLLSFDCSHLRWWSIITLHLVLDYCVFVNIWLFHALASVLWVLSKTFIFFRIKNIFSVCHCYCRDRCESGSTWYEVFKNRRERSSKTSKRIISDWFVGQPNLSWSFRYSINKFKKVLTRFWDSFIKMSQNHWLTEDTTCHRVRWTTALFDFTFCRPWVDNRVPLNTMVRCSSCYSVVKNKGDKTVFR